MLTNIRTRCWHRIKFSRRTHTKQSINPFPYPTHRNPTPHQIFHLPQNASVDEIKARYYDLVRLYHPDKVVSSSIPPEIAHEHFQAITAAYDKLRGKTLAGLAPDCDEATGSRQNQYQTTAAYRAMQRRRQELYNSGPVDDSRRDHLLMAGVFATIFFVVIHNLTTRREAISEVLNLSRSRISVQVKNSRRTEAEQRLSLDNESESDPNP